MSIIPPSKSPQNDFKLYYSDGKISKNCFFINPRPDTDSVEIAKSRMPDGEMIMSDKTRLRLDRKLTKTFFDGIGIGAVFGLITFVPLPLMALFNRGHLKFNPKGLSKTLGLLSIPYGALAMFTIAEHLKWKQLEKKLQSSSFKEDKPNLK